MDERCEAGTCLDGSQFCPLDDYVSTVILHEDDEIADLRLELLPDFFREGDAEARLHSAVSHDFVHALLGGCGFARSYYAVFRHNGKMVHLKPFQTGLAFEGLDLSGFSKVALIVLTRNGNADTDPSDEELRRELERMLTSSRTIHGKWTVERVTIFGDQ